MPIEVLSDHHVETQPRGVAAHPGAHTGVQSPLFVHPAEGEAPVTPGAAAAVLVALLARGLARYRAMVCLASEAPDAAPPDRMLITVEVAEDGDLHVSLFLPGSDRLRLDLIDLGVYRLLENGLLVDGVPVRMVPLPCFSRLTVEEGLLRKDVIYRITRATGPVPADPLMAFGGHGAHGSHGPR